MTRRVREVDIVMLWLVYLRWWQRFGCTAAAAVASIECVGAIEGRKFVIEVGVLECRTTMDAMVLKLSHWSLSLAGHGS